MKSIMTKRKSWRAKRGHPFTILQSIILTVLLTNMFNLTCTDAAAHTTRITDKFSDRNLLELCGGHISSTRICDPNSILNKKTHRNRMDTVSITEALSDLEINHSLKCYPNMETEIQMAVVVVNSIRTYGDNSREGKERCTKKLANSLHDQWGVGNTECNGSGILLLLSIDDRTLYISTSQGLEQSRILSRRHIDTITDSMKPFLIKKEYAEAIIEAINCIVKYVDKGPPTFLEEYGELIMVRVRGIWRELIMVLLITTAYLGGDHFSKKIKKTDYERVRVKLSQLDRDRALMLMGKYECSSCPICFKDFKVRPNSQPSHRNGSSSDVGNSNINENKRTSKSMYELGSDGKPITLLRCGHAFDRTCWDEWISKCGQSVHQCPICKRNIEDSPSVSTDTTTANESIFITSRRGHRERFEDSWTRSDYGERLEQDTRSDLMESDYNETDPSTSEEFSSFGGGGSGGGGGGSW